MGDFDATPELLTNLAKQAEDYGRTITSSHLESWAEDLRKERHETYVAEKVALTMWERTRRDGDLPWGVIVGDTRDKWVAAAMAALREVEKYRE